MLNDLFPDQFKLWDFIVPNQYWTREMTLKILKHTIEEQEKLTETQLLNLFKSK